MLSVNHHVQSYSYPQCESDKDVANQRKGIPDISDKHRFHWLIDGLTVAHAKNFEVREFVINSPLHVDYTKGHLIATHWMYTMVYITAADAHI